MNISYPSEVWMESSRKKLIVEFTHEDSNVECCYKVKEFNYLKGLKQRARMAIKLRTIMIRTDFFCNICIGLRVDSYVVPHIIMP